MALGRRNKKKKIHSLLKSTVKKCHKRGRNFTRKKTPMNKHKKSRKNIISQIISNKKKNKEYSLKKIILKGK